MNDEPTIDITEAEPKAVRVNRREIKVGDRVFDTFGGTHEVVRVRHHKNVTTAVRDDGPAFTLVGDETITVLKEV